MEDIGIVGCGNWGRNLIRVFDQIATVDTCCHTGNKQNRQWMQDNHPDIRLTTEYDTLLDRSDIVVIATPIDTHYDLAKQALEANAHVFVEKPLTTDVDEASHLVKLADTRNRMLFVGYIFVHHPVFQRILEIHRDKPIEYAKFEWARTGSFGDHIIANHASHDLALATCLFGASPDTATVRDRVHVRGEPNIISFDLSFNNARCRIDVDRLSPDKRKTMTLVTRAGDVYHWSDNTLQRLNGETFSTVYESMKEPLEVECQSFLDTVSTDKSSVTDGTFGLEVTKLMRRFNYPASTDSGISD